MHTRADSCCTESIGIDLEAVDRFRTHPFLHEGRFWRNIFSTRELARLATYSDPYPHAAGMFTAKEALVKALAFFKIRVSVRHVEIHHEKNGRPSVSLKGVRDIVCQVSISHTEEFACATALCKKICSGVRRAKHEKRRNTKKD